MRDDVEALTLKFRYSAIFPRRIKAIRAGSWSEPAQIRCVRSWIILPAPNGI